MAIEKINDSIQTVSEITVGQLKKYKEQNPDKFKSKFGHIDFDGLSDEDVIVRERKWDGGATNAKVKGEVLSNLLQMNKSTENQEIVDDVEKLEEKIEEAEVKVEETTNADEVTE